ncbi:DUF6261 family protein [Aquimarina algiphila]|uniref:DUF6261 family protein n=1 Tax=Aquimarina algiphila TaxID=2047982 RepID=UPI00232A94D9|nr:DUF6261 family protein [Aquimarina algiphila]
MIKEVYYSYLNPENLISLAELSAKIVKNNHPDESLFSKSITNLNTTIKQAELAVGKSSKEALTNKVYEADTNRDATFIGFRNHIDAGLRRHRNVEYLEACKRLNSIINTHGRDVHKLPYVEQSTVFNSLQEALNTKTAKNDLVTTNTTDWVGDLSLDQQEFEMIFAQRNANKAANITITDKESVQLLKPELKKFYILINAFYINEQVSGLENTINEINSTIDRILVSAKR